MAPNESSAGNSRVKRANLVLHIALEVHRADLTDRDVHQTSLRAVGWTEPNRSAVRVRVKEGALFCGFGTL
jgi:hypothetical protein